MSLSPEATLRLLAYDWPGNVRELRSLVDFAAAASREGVLGAGPVAEWLAAHRGGETPTREEPPSGRFRPLADELEELERRRIVEALRAAGGNQVVAAGLISMPLRTFRLRVKRYGLQRVGR
jgi:DNA-binding NtrC family response regulator